MSNYNRLEKTYIVGGWLSYYGGHSFGHIHNGKALEFDDDKVDLETSYLIIENEKRVRIRLCIENITYGS